jgi:hypothetical protein
MEDNMKGIKDTTNGLKRFRQNQSLFLILKGKIEAAGGKCNMQIWPTIEELEETLRLHKHRLFSKYYGVDDIVHVYNIVEGEIPNDLDPEISKVPLQNWTNARGRQTHANELYEMVSWGDNFDPVSRLIIVALAAARADNAAFNLHNEDKRWLEHNAKYYSKIGMTSQYFPQLLRIAEKGYEKDVDVQWSDKTIEAAVNATLILQQSLGDMHLVPMDLDKVHEEALSKNNKSAESAPAFRNQKHEDVREEVLADAEFIRDNCDYTDLELINEQRRIQSGGNVLFDTYYPIKLDSEGKIIFDLDQIKLAVMKCASERGYQTILYEKEPKVLEDMSALITVDTLPFSEEERAHLANEYDDDSYLKKDYTGEWRYNYYVTFPNVFTLVSDKYPELDELSNKIFAKTRSIKAAMSAHSRVGQSYLYPFIEEWKKRCLVKDSPYFSFVAQWSHPDDLKAMVTTWAKVALPEDAAKELTETIYNEEKVKSTKDIIKEVNGFLITTSDDKSGFDMFNPILFCFLFYTTFLSIPFDMNDNNIRILKYLAVNDILCLMSGVDDLILYTDLIGSGQFSTSLRGTHSSDLASLIFRQVLVDPDNHEFEDKQEDGVNPSVPEEEENDEVLGGDQL